MFGLIGCMRAAEGRRDELLAILSAQIGEMPGCKSYVIAADARDADAIWITEAPRNKKKFVNLYNAFFAGL